MTSFWPYRLQMINSEFSLTVTQNVQFTFKSYILHKILQFTPASIRFREAIDASETFYDIRCLIVFFFVKKWKLGFSSLKKLNMNSSIIFLSKLCSFRRGPSLCFNNNVCFLCRGRTFWKSWRSLKAHINSGFTFLHRTRAVHVCSFTYTEMASQWPVWTGETIFFTAHQGVSMKAENGHACNFFTTQ